MSAPDTGRGGAGRTGAGAGRTGARGGRGATAPARTGAWRRPGEGAGREEVTYRGVRWRRADGAVSWLYEEEGRWVRWRPGDDAPPRPPGWDRPARPPRAGWLSGWRIVPLVIVVIVLVIAAFQALHPTGNPVKAEAAASAKLLGHCLAQDGSAEGHPRYSSTPVPCDSPKAAVKVVEVLPSTGGQRCPTATVGVQLAYAGVTHPHVECVAAVHARPSR